MTTHLGDAENVDEVVPLDQGRLSPQGGLQDRALAVSKPVLDLQQVAAGSELRSGQDYGLMPGSG